MTDEIACRIVYDSQLYDITSNIKTQSWFYLFKCESNSSVRPFAFGQRRPVVSRLPSLITSHHRRCCSPQLYVIGMAMRPTVHPRWPSHKCSSSISSAPPLWWRPSSSPWWCYPVGDCGLPFIWLEISQGKPYDDMIISSFFLSKVWFHNF